jgi:hypothetical protein
VARRKQSGRSRKENVEFSVLDQQRGADRAARKKLRIKRSKQCAGQDCGNTENLGTTFQHTSRTPDLICPTCRFKHFNVPESFPPATKQDWRIFNAGYLDERRDDPVRASQAENPWYHAGRMTGVETVAKDHAREGLIETAQEEVDRVFAELKESGGEVSVANVVREVKKRMGI